MSVRNARRFAIAIALLSIALGFAHLISIREAPQFIVPVLDEAAYDTQAMGVLQGTWPGKKVFYQDPLYPYFLAVNYKIFGHSFIAPKVMQVLFGAVTLLFIFGIALRALGPNLAAIAITLAAFYRPLYFFEGLLTKELLGVMFLSAALYALLRARASNKIWIYFASGILLGIACLTRANLLLVATCWALWIFIFVKKQNNFIAATKTSLAFCFGIAIAISPVTIHNVRAGDFVLITSQAGQNFFIGNHVGNTTGTYAAPPFLRSNPLFEESDFIDEAYRNTGMRMSSGELSEYWYGKTWSYIRNNKKDFAVKAYRKALLVINQVEISDNVNFYFFKLRYSWVLRLPTPTWGILSALGLFGFFALSFRLFRHDNEIKSEVVPIMILFPVYAATLVAFYVFSRYRIYLLVALAPLAAYGIKEIADIIASRKMKKIIPAGAALTGLFLLTHQSVLEPHLDVAYFQTGNGFLKLGRYKEAENEYIEALNIRPDSPPYLINLALSQHLQGKEKNAIAIYTEAIKLAPRNVNARIGLGDTYAALGEYDQAIAHYQIGALYGGDSPEVWFKLGKAYLKLGIKNTALSSFEKALNLDPDNKEIRNAIKEALDSAPQK